MKALRRLIGVMAVSALMILGIATAGTASPPNEPGTVRTVAQANAVEQQTIRDAIREDREGYQQRLALIAKAEALNEYLEAFPEYGIKKQQRLIAASMGTEALAALIELTDSGAITIVSSTATDGSPRAEFIINEAPGAAVQTGEMQTMALP